MNSTENVYNNNNNSQAGKEQCESLLCFSEDIEMEFWIKKCGSLMLQRGNIVRSEGIELPNGSVMKDIEGSG